jgi:hypothetical protein
MFLLYYMNNFIKEAEKLLDTLLVYKSAMSLYSFSESDMQAEIAKLLDRLDALRMPAECQVVLNQFQEFLNKFISLSDDEADTQCDSIVRSLKRYIDVMKRMKSVPAVLPKITPMPKTATPSPLHGSNFFSTSNELLPPPSIPVPSYDALMAVLHPFLYEISSHVACDTLEVVMLIKSPQIEKMPQFEIIHTNIMTSFAHPFQKIKFDNFANIRMVFVYFTLLLRQLTRCQYSNDMFQPLSTFCKLLMQHIKNNLSLDANNTLIKDHAHNFIKWLDTLNVDIDNCLHKAPCTLAQNVERYTDMLNPFLYGEWLIPAQQYMRDMFNMLQQSTAANTFMKK